jgi:hypothetical protein
MVRALSTVHGHPLLGREAGGLPPRITRNYGSVPITRKVSSTCWAMT